MQYKWHQHIDNRDRNHDISLYGDKLSRLLKHVGQDPRADCYRLVERLKNPIHSALRTSMQLSKGNQGGVIVTDYIPDNIRIVLDDIPEVLLWIIALYPQLRDTSPLLERVSGSKVQILDFLNVNINETSVRTTSNDLKELLEKADIKIKQILAAVVKPPMDMLGSYNPITRRIEIYWIAIFITSIGLSIPFDRLTYVVLVHELAHYYTHAGKDADGNTWHTEAYTSASLSIVEGLAQFWTSEICAKHNYRLGIISSHTVQNCFRMLLERQDTAYRCYQDWLPSHPRRIEVVRGALLQIRERKGDYNKFRELLDEIGILYG